MSLSARCLASAAFCMLIGRISRTARYGRQSLRKWVTQAEVSDGQKPGIRSAERQEFQRFQKENASLSVERPISLTWDSGIVIRFSAFP